MFKTCRLFLLTISAVTLTACATGAIQPTYVSPTQYQDWSCPQLHQEYARLKQHLAQGVEPATRTGVGVGIGIGGGWGRGGFGVVPNISIGMGQSANTRRSEIARLYGQQDAIEQMAKFKNCPIQNPRPKS